MSFRKDNLILKKLISEGRHGKVYLALFNRRNASLNPAEMDVNEKEETVIVKILHSRKDRDIEMARLRLIAPIAANYAVTLFEPYYLQAEDVIDKLLIVLVHLHCTNLGFMKDYSYKPFFELRTALTEIHKYLTHNDIGVSNIVFDEIDKKYKFIDFGTERCDSSYQYDWQCLGRALKTYYAGSCDPIIIKNVGIMIDNMISKAY
jgi:serine/threonine protein kinase